VKGGDNARRGTTIDALVQTVEYIRTPNWQRWLKKPAAYVRWHPGNTRLKKLLEPVAEEKTISGIQLREFADEPGGIDANAGRFGGDAIGSIESDAHTLW
jgi:hypothetical protein